MTGGEYLRSYRSLWGLGVAVTAAGPLALWQRDMQPPWPEGAQAVAVLFCVLVAIVGFSVGRQMAGGGQKGRQRTLLWAGSLAIALGLGCGIRYLVDFNQFVVPDKQTVGSETRIIRVVIGTELVGRAEGMETPKELLQENGYDPEKVWTRGSLLRVRMRLFTAFAGTFGLFTFGLTLLAAAGGGQPGKSASAG